MGASGTDVTGNGVTQGRGWSESMDQRPLLEVESSMPAKAMCVESTYICGTRDMAAMLAGVYVNLGM